MIRNEAAVLAAPTVQAGVDLEGRVLDQTLAPIAGARVVLRSASRVVATTETSLDGQFHFQSLPVETGILTAEAQGFGRVTRKWNHQDSPKIELVLFPALLQEQVAVTPTRTETRLGDTASSVQILSQTDLSTTAATTIDDALRQVPGFQLFRRSGSRTANPTTQGVSLRGVGASGASRAVVLVDDIPLNDPFGSWVYWGRVPRESVSRIEVLRGATSDLYGSGALGGVVNILTRKVERPTLDFEASYGNQSTPDASLFTGARRGHWGVSLAAESLKTAGYVLVAPDERGPIDTRANSRRGAIDFKLGFEKTKNVRFFLGTSYFGEARKNGTPLQINRTHIRQLSAGADLNSQSIGAVAFRFFASAQVFDQNFSTVASNRSSETLTRIQRVPSQGTGLNFHWSRALGPTHTLIAGLEAREVRGASDELVFSQGRSSSLVGAGGRERDLAAYVKDIVRIGRSVSLVAGARFDHWRNYRAHSDTHPLSVNLPTSVKSFADRSESAVSPQASLVYRPNDRASFFISGYGAFRAPTLNELYRSFRVGNVLTLAKDELVAERLKGGEGGASLTLAEGKVGFRGAFFWSEISKSIANVTLNIAPELITRERRNLGKTRSLGTELEMEARLGRNWVIGAGYLLSSASVTAFPVDTTLEGKAIPQVPRHSLAVQLRYSKPSRLSFGLQTRVLGAQFDDDLNLFRLPGYSTVDALVARPLSHQLELFVASENLFNRRYVVGRTPITTLGPPRLVRLGIRFRLHSQR